MHTGCLNVLATDPSISHTQNLTSLHLAHTTLVETHGSTLASLQHLGSTNTTLTSQLTEPAQVIDALKDQIELAKGDAQQPLWRVPMHKKQEWTTSRLMNASSNVYPNLGLSFPNTSPRLPLSPTTPSTPAPHAESPHALLNELPSLKSRSESEITNTELEEKVDKLEQGLFELSGEIAKGRHIPPNTHVLQLVDNFEQQWFDLRQATLDKLRSENVAPLDRLYTLELSTPHPSTTSKRR
ncbi:hypothetical protein P691DRAFT_761852 [Macrolepiota fuliginosa MF-IS2]|uniref:Uncharacterized protein n=1 Tax=Macrolepiota fuliginosa MF-IS2 TaxID=1400762 RepID=A0A9P5XA26_9AGAR|nr:hypothetical protein P691DRAFT_761852 [Macrolepiota fuliginosa MF-IS2]